MAREPRRGAATKSESAWKRNSKITTVRNLHDSIAGSICCWVYSRLPNMKARWSIAGALLFALMLAPSALRASTAPMGASSCPASKAQFAGKPAAGSLVELLPSRPGQYSPAPRLHRLRGKRINVQNSAIQALHCFVALRFLVPDALSGPQVIDGPNPSRGPPLQL